MMLARAQAGWPYALLIAIPQLFPWLVGGALLAGLLGTILPALGVYAHNTMPTLTLFEAFFAWPGITNTLIRTVVLGFSAAILSLVIASVIAAAAIASSPLSRCFKVLCTPFLLLPHVSVALAVLFLLAPTGLIARALAHSLFHWTVPPDVASAPDVWGGGYVLVLVLKEVPFLWLMMLTCLHHMPLRPTIESARAMGFAWPVIWLKLILPRLYHGIRVPMLIVVGYSFTAVEESQIMLAATTPTLSALIVEWSRDADVNRFWLAAVGAVVQLGLTGAGIGLWWTGGKAVGWCLRGWLTNGQRGQARWRHGVWAALVAMIGGVLTLALVGLPILGLWAFVDRWPWPDLVPSWTLETVHAYSTPLWRLVGPTLLCAVLAVTTALVMTLTILERCAHTGRSPLVWIAVAVVILLIPQPVSVLGITHWLIVLGFQNFPAVVMVHTLFVLPYVLMIVYTPFTTIPSQWVMSCHALGASPWRTFWRLRLPIVLRPILVAGAVGIAVSLSLYLPTLIVGGGRMETLTTEAVAMSAGLNRRWIGLVSLAQMAGLAVVFFVAWGWPRVQHRHRRGMTTDG